MNLLYYGDNLEFLRRRIADECGKRAEAGAAHHGRRRR